MKITSMSVELVDFMGSDDSVVNAARVSFHKDASQYSKEQNIKLINYLCKHNHWTPLAHAFLSFRIKAPIFVARQLVKHQVGLAWNEVSRRYVDDEPEFWFLKEWRGRPVNAKQGSSGVIDDNQPHCRLSSVTSWTTARCLETYNDLLKAGVAPEQARMILPQNTMTEWIWSGSLAAFSRVCKLRLDDHAQQETREVVSYIRNYMVELFPVSFNALMEN